MMTWWAVFFVAGFYIQPDTFQVCSICGCFAAAFLAYARWTAYGGPKHGLAQAYGQFLPRRCITRLAVIAAALVIWQHAGMRAFPEPVYGNTGCPVTAAERLHLAVASSLEGPPLSGRSRFLLQAIILAERSGMDRNVRDAYEYLGIAHFLALSGLHAGIIIIPLGMILSAAGLSRIWKHLVLLSIIAFYTAVTRFPPSLVRVLFLYVFFFASRAVRARASLLDALTGGTFILYCIEPEIVYSRGFQLSFSAVAAIALIGMPVTGMIRSAFHGGFGCVVARAVLIPAAISVSVQIFTLPLVLLYFGRASLMAPLVNVIILYPFTALLYLGLLYISVPVPFVRAVLAWPVNLLSDMLCGLPAGIADRPHPGIYRGALNPALYIAGLLLLSASLGGRCTRRYLVLTAAFITICASLILRSGSEDAKVQGVDLREQYIGGRYRPRSISFIEIGKGILIVRGNTSPWTARMAVRTLWSKGYSGAGCLVIERCGWSAGACYILSRIRIGEIVYSRYDALSAETLREKAEELSIPLVEVSAGDVLVRDGYTMKITAPSFPPPAGCIIEAGKTSLRYRILRNVDYPAP